jgi:hypothetical protein
MREMNYQDRQQFERATMLNDPLNLYWFYAVLCPVFISLIFSTLKTNLQLNEK